MGGGEVEEQGEMKHDLDDNVERARAERGQTPEVVEVVIALSTL